MRFALVSLLPFVPWPGVLGGQIPIIDGVIGGVPGPSISAFIEIPQVQNVTTTPGKLRVVENSGICETTPGVYQASGYGDLTATESLWFWFFAARKNPETAPLVLWFNGGPGSSSMIGLLQEHANVLYIDQPVGVGFSHGDLKVGTSQEAAADVWTFIQIFLSDHRFSKLRSNKLGIWTESYGGHYGPTFAAYFLTQNLAIRERKISGAILNLQVLGVGDGLTNPLIQYPGYITYSGVNPYHPLVTQDVIDAANTSWTTPVTGCRDMIGGEVTWTQSSNAVYRNFSNTGDWMRNSAPDLEFVINSGVRTIVYDGDADYILNFNGVEAMVNNLETIYSPLFKLQKFKNFSVSGQTTGIFKNAGTFSYVRIYGAGHEVPAYKYGKLAYGQAAAQMFTQIMRDEGLSST
ncbi:Alpha/Beta hydrolase protein [Flammula alnicola]|nr:Alpha/Beta hydrolase protein [Flammula alnicola]